MPACLPVAAILLAAGAATRMGKLKQLLDYRGRTLVQHSIQQAIEAGFGPVIVVVGAEAEAVRSAIAAERVDIVHNENWQSGMGSSLSAGVRRLNEIAPECAAAAILLADQPLVGAQHLKAMRKLLAREGNPIVAASYQDTLGVPALFRRDLFAMLASLPPEAGARKILRDSGMAVTPFPLPEAAVDLDTPEDWSVFEEKSRVSS